MTELAQLLANLEPRRRPGDYCFCCTTQRQARALEWAPVARFREEEGVTVVVPQSTADAAGLEYEGVWAQIELGVHSDLTALGLLAAVCARLAEANIPVNAFSAVHHDHLFVPEGEAHRALDLLSAGGWE